MNFSEEELQNLVSQCEQALWLLYNEQNPANRDGAHKWLLGTQKSNQAWQLCWRLMQKEKPSEVQFFGASMLHFKIKMNWSDLGEDHYDVLQSELFRHISAFSGGPKIVLTRLCVAVSADPCHLCQILVNLTDDDYSQLELGAYALQTMPEHWKNCITDIINTFCTSSNPQTTNTQTILLEILTVVPEEFHSTDMVSTRRKSLRIEMQAAVPRVLSIIQNGLSACSSIQTKLQALQCMFSWIQFGVNIEEVDHLLLSVFSCLDNEELFDAAIDALIEVITYPTVYRFPSYVWKFVGNTLQLQGPLVRSLENGDTDTSTGICRLIVSLLEIHYKLLLSADTADKHQQTHLLIQLVLGCTNAPGWYPVDEQCSEMTLNVWFLLQDHITSEEPALSQQHKATFGPVFMALVQVLLRKVQYPPEDEWKSFSSDEKEQFRCYRQDIADTIMYMYCLMRHHYLQYLHETLSMLLTAEAPPTWQALDATLYLIQSVSEFVEPDEGTYLPGILSLLSKLPSLPSVAETALLMVGSYSEWLKCHPEQLKSAVAILVGGLSTEHLASASTQALRSICEECVLDLEQETAHLVFSSCQAALAGTLLQERERIRCMECIGHVLSIQDRASQTTNLATVTRPYAEQLMRIVQQPCQEAKSKLQFYLRLFAVLFRCLDPNPETVEKENHPASQALREILPALKAMNVWITDNEVVQSLCLCLEKAIDTIRDHLGPLISEIGQILIQYFTFSSNSHFIDTGIVFIGMYGDSSDHYQLVKNLFASMATGALHILQSNFRHHPDIVQSLVRLAFKVLRTNPRIMFECDGLHESLFQCGLVAVTMPESPTVKAASHYFVAFISVSEQENDARTTLLSHGKQLVWNILQDIGGGAPRTCINELSEILLTLNKQMVTQFAQWMQELLQVEGFPSNLVTSSQKQTFTSSLLRERVHKRRFKDTVKDFSLMCRGLYGTPYACG